MLKTGEQAPNFSLESSNGKQVSLYDFKGKYIVLYFYPKDMTPGCTTQACDYRDKHSEFGQLNAAILGISRDNINKHNKFIEKYKLPFLLLSDTDGDVCNKYGVLKEKSMFGKKYMGIERSTFIIDPEGIIVKADRKVSHKDDVTNALSFIEGATVNG